MFEWTAFPDQADGGKCSAETLEVQIKRQMWVVSVFFFCKVGVRRTIVVCVTLQNKVHCRLFCSWILLRTMVLFNENSNLKCEKDHFVVVVIPHKNNNHQCLKWCLIMWFRKIYDYCTRRVIYLSLGQYMIYKKNSSFVTHIKTGGKSRITFHTIVALRR